MIGRITTAEENGPPPDAACTLYPGEVMHARLKGPLNRFAYKVFSVLIDLDRLDEAGRLSALFSVNRPNLASFHDRDHVDRQGETVRAHSDRLLAEAGLGRPHRVLLLCYPRIFGYVFNPISVYYCYDRDGGLVALIYAVRNTFGQRHAYVAPIEPGEAGPAGVRQVRTKIFHVSPFIDLGARYHFRVLPPGRVVRLRIHETESGQPLLSATFVGEARPMTTAALAACLLKFPLLTWKIMAGIHWEALKLWLRGARFYRSPPPPKPASYRDEGAALEPGE
ncbi:MAG: DUF1365 domain-containing protein [Rhizobiaceae bacterium]